MIIILVGPSGAGKTAIANEMTEHYGFKKVVTTTTRTPREGEIDGVSYHFLTTEEFEKKKKKNNEFCETAVYAGAQYGTQKSDLSSAPNMVMVMEIGGALKIHKLFPESKICFVERPKEKIIEAIEERPISADEKKKRIAQYEKDMTFSTILKCHIIVHNTKDLTYAVEQITKKI